LTLGQHGAVLGGAQFPLEMIGKYYIGTILLSIVYFLGSFKLFRTIFSNEYFNDGRLSFEEFGIVMGYFALILLCAHVTSTFYFSRSSGKQKKYKIEPPEPKSPHRVVDVLDDKAGRLQKQPRSKKRKSKKKSKE